MAVGYVIQPYRSSSRHGRNNLILIPKMGCRVHCQLIFQVLKLYFSDTKPVALKNARAQLEERDLLSKLLCMNNCQRQGNLRAWGKALTGLVLTSYLDDTVGD